MLRTGNGSDLGYGKIAKLGSYDASHFKRRYKKLV